MRRTLRNIAGGPQTIEMLCGIDIDTEVERNAGDGDRRCWTSLVPTTSWGKTGGKRLPPERLVQFGAIWAIRDGGHGT